jgi:hypothetical protein
LVRAIFLAGKKHARNFVESQPKNYNWGRLHTSLGGLTPKEFAESVGKLKLRASLLLGVVVNR